MPGCVISPYSSRVILASLLRPLERCQFLMDLIVSLLCRYGPALREMLHQFWPILFVFILNILFHFSRAKCKGRHQLWWTLVLLWHIFSKLMSIPNVLHFGQPWQSIPSCSGIDLCCSSLFWQECQELLVLNAFPLYPQAFECCIRFLRSTFNSQVICSRFWSTLVCLLEFHAYSPFPDNQCF